jgi:glycosyltransferase involved in cell wall biosynthesis
MRLVFFGTFDSRRHPRVRVLQEGFAAHGDEVLECVEPLEFDTAARVRALHHPWRAPLIALRVLRAWRRLRRRVRALPRPDVVIVGYLGHLDVHLARRLFPGVPIVLDHLVSLADTAMDRRSGSPALQRTLARVDRAAVRAADLVLVDTHAHLALLPPEAQRRARVIAVGSPETWFRPPADRDQRPLRVVFFGLFTPLQGAPVIGEAIGRLGGEPITFTMVGGGQDLAAARAAAARGAPAEWIDWVEAEQLPALVAAHDVCLGIFGTSPKAGRVVPNKVFQGAAAGCAIVTSDTPPQRRALADAAVLVPPGDAGALAAALRALAHDPERVASLRKAAARHADAEFRPHSIVADLRTELGFARARPSARLPVLSANAWLRHDLIMRALRDANVRSVLEIGAGLGAMGARLAARFEYVGLEPDPVSFAIAQHRIGGLGAIYNVEASALEPDRVFDAVCAFEVLEHIRDDAGALREWRARLRPGGVLVLSLPAFQRRFAAADRKAGHFRRYDRAQLARLLHEAGFADVQVWTYGFALGHLLEFGRNLLAVGEERRARAESDAIAERTAASGRWRQPPQATAELIRLATAPFRVLQRPFAGTRYGTGFVVRARRPA